MAGLAISRQKKKQSELQIILYIPSIQKARITCFLTITKAVVLIKPQILTVWQATILSF